MTRVRNYDPEPPTLWQQDIFQAMLLHVQDLLDPWHSRGGANKQGKVRSGKLPKVDIGSPNYLTYPLPCFINLNLLAL